ncbi:hypothetical protein PoB_007258600 [Plakobranchus ocellatus]|uniref:Uncharacterized protein n=1 Tax=Plakobranchus ocellatus TaxID=259542 RepID=A0AAV4DQF5_9GAST|nr:hypothetical protein PoB_007258600 [Plakobranchus ocellatus]
MCTCGNLRARPGGASLVLLVFLMEYPLPGPVVALLSQEKAALAPKSYLISSCKKSIKITLVYAKDNQTRDQVVATSTTTATPAAVTPAAAATATAAASATAGASTARASSTSSLVSTSSSLSSSAERKKPRHASGSGRQNRKKKRKNKNSSKGSRSSIGNIVLPRVSKLSESSSSPSPGQSMFGSTALVGNGSGGLPSSRNGENPKKQEEDSCSTPEFPLLFGGHDEEGDHNHHHHPDVITRERMSTVDSGVPSSNGTMAYEHTAESGASDDDHGTRDMFGLEKMVSKTGKRQENLPKDKAGAGNINGKHSKDRTEEKKVRTFPVELPRRILGISESSFSSLSSSDENEPEPGAKNAPPKEAKNTATPTARSSASTSRLPPGAQTPVKWEEKWQTWTRIPRTQAPLASARPKLTAVPAIACRPPNTSSVASASNSTAHRGHGQNSSRDSSNSNRRDQEDGAENL